MKPLRNEIAVQPFEAKGTTNGGLIIPESYRQRPSKATVKHLGMAVKGLKVNDIVFHVLGAGRWVDTGEDKVLMIPVTDCLAFIPSEN